MFPLHLPSIHRAQVEWIALVLLLGALVVLGGPLGRQVTDGDGFDAWPDPTGQIRRAGPIVRLDLALYDSGLGLSAVPPDPSLVTVAIDEDSIGQVGRWPWRRAVTAELIRRIAEAKPAAIAVDVLFPETTSDDALLADAIRFARPILAVARQQTADGTFLPLYPSRAVAGDARLAQVVMSLGPDGLVRGLFAREGRLPAMALALQDPGVVGDPAAADAMIARGAWDRSDPLLPRALSRPPPSVSAAAVLRGEVGPGVLAGKRVLLGTTSIGVGDVFSSALIAGRLQAHGIELHAAAASALLGGQLIRPLDAPLASALHVAILVGVMVLLYRLPPGYSIAVVVTAIVATVAVTLAAFRAGLWVAPGSLLAALALAYPLWSWRRLSAAVAGLRLQTRTLRPRTTVFDDLNRDPGTIEPISRRISHLANASMQVQRLNRFLQDGMESLPHPVLVTDPRGLVMYLNLRMIDAFAPAPPRVGAPVDAWFESQFQGRLVPDPSGDVRARECVDARGRQWLLSFNQTGAIEPPSIDARAGADHRADAAEREARRWLLQLVDITAVRAAEREREEALSFLSHDLRSPQASILSMAEHHDALPAPEIDRTALSRHARRPLELTDQFLSFARAGSKPIELAEYDLADLLTECVDLSWEKARARGVRLTGSIDATGPGGASGNRNADGDGDEALVHIDVGLVRRAVLNLIENAIRHCAVGGAVTVALGRTEAEWTLTVLDEGPGIPPEALDAMFQAFWQRPAGAIGENVGAAGLGLAMVERTMSRHQGSVRAENRTDRTGARFTISLPARSAATMPAISSAYANPHARTESHDRPGGAA
ncbi:MAG: CHASE2 domain-containing protein [Lautropia sp.]